MGTIEVLNAHMWLVDRANTYRWEPVNGLEGIKARFDAIFAPLNSHELLILGGRSDLVDSDTDSILSSYTIVDI